MLDLDLIDFPDVDESESDPAVLQLHDLVTYGIDWKEESAE